LRAFIASSSASVIAGFSSSTSVAGASATGASTEAAASAFSTWPMALTVDAQHGPGARLDGHLVVVLIDREDGSEDAEGRHHGLRRARVPI
jgi:hypothetical protein